MWANLHLLFWLTLVPFATAWVDENHFAALPTAVYGFVLLMAGFAYTLLQRAIIACHGGDESVLAIAVGGDLKGKLSLAGYAAAIGIAFYSPIVSNVIYALIALLWLIPDRRIQATIRE
jgi:uncharacterized membrane protein